jgi:molecular chaperone DnaK (HSP70)
MAQSVLGISIGSQNTVISTFKSGIVNVILSDSSNRQIPTVTSYNDRERNIAELALQTNKSNFKRTIISPNRWLGIQKNWQNYILEESKFSNIPPIISPNGKIGFQINYKGKNEFYSPESLLGLFLNKLQNNWLREKIITDDIVISIPDYYTVYERKAMIESIEISNIQCTSLINESSAISLAYGLFRLKEFDDEKERIVGFVDMGHSKTTIFFGSFTKKKNESNICYK